MVSDLDKNGYVFKEMKFVRVEVARRLSLKEKNLKHKMSTYFILTKQSGNDIGNDEKNQIIYVKDKVYILPKNNINYYINNGLFEKSLIEWCKQFCKKEQNILDIGAHSGTYSISLSECCNKLYYNK